MRRPAPGGQWCTRQQEGTTVRSGYSTLTDNAPATGDWRRDLRKSERTLPDRDEYIQRAAQLVPVLQERAAQTEALRRVPEETIDTLCAADLLRVLVPARYGGP